MPQAVQIEFGTISGETVFLAIAMTFVIFLLAIHTMMRGAKKEQVENFDKFKTEVSKELGTISADMRRLREQSEGADRAKERRLETIEHSTVTKEEFFRENTLLKAAYDDLGRYILQLSGQLDNLKTLIIGKLNDPK